VEDPHELTNRAADPELAEMITDLRAEVAKRWDFEAITKAVIESQRSRRVVGAANAVGKATAWDYQPPRNAGEEYVRAHMDLEELEAMARFPRVRS